MSPLAGCLLAMLCTVVSVQAQQPAAPAGWPVRGAALRVEAAVRERPDDPDLGVYVQIPDGGLLPRHATAEVRDADGKPLESRLIWHTPADAMGLVFRPPETDGPVSIYLRGGATPPPKPPADSLKPSLFVFTRSGRASIENARAMATEWPPAGGAFGGPIDRIGIRWNPFGPDDQFSSWFTGWFKLGSRETIYLATISDEGSEIHLDGALFTAWPGRHTRAAGAKGQFGKSVTLDAGWHRIDYFHFEIDGDQEMCLVWKRGSDSADALARFMEGRAWGKTGRAEVLGITAADGRVAGWVEGNLQAGGYLWVGNQPIHRHTLTCRGLRAAADLKIAWDFGHGRTVRAATCDWLVPGGDAPPSTATLTVTSPAGVLRQTFRITSFTAPREHALGNPSDRLAYRQTFLDMLEAAAPGQNPVAAWSGDLWATLAAVLDVYKGGPILTNVFDRGWSSIQSLPPDQRNVLEDRWAETLRLLQDTAGQLAWIDRLEKATRDRARQFRWREERVACLLHDAGDVEAARRAARAMREAASQPDEIHRAVLRQGDVELAAGDRERAARYYADAQTRYRARHRLGDAAAAPSFPSGGGAAAGTPLRSLLGASQNLKRSDAWKLYAVNDAAQSATLRAYLAQDAVEEAFAALAQWENDTPMSKLNGDFLLAEARTYAHVGDYRRTASVLAAYRHGDRTTSELPEAMELQMQALSRLRRFDQLRPIAEEAIKRFPGLPLAEAAARFLRETGTR